MAVENLMHGVKGEIKTPEGLEHLFICSNFCTEQRQLLSSQYSEVRFFTEGSRAVLHEGKPKH